MSSYLLISDAAKEVQVESHVLRYWEEELQLTIKRNELGHRYYTKEDVERFRQIKSMKERGFQLKAIKMILKDGKLDVINPDYAPSNSAKEEEHGMAIEIVEPKAPVPMAESKEAKSRRLQWMLQQMIRETLKENNTDLCREIKENIAKELDYQFRMQEEREDAREETLRKRNDEYYKKIDDLLRIKSRPENRFWGKKKKGTS